VADPTLGGSLASAKMVSLVEEFRNRYSSRIVIFDLPPLLDQANGLAFSPYADPRADQGGYAGLGTGLTKSGRSDMNAKTMRQRLLD